MHVYFYTVISWLCLLTGLSAEECSLAVLAKRATFFVPEGSSLSLSCVVQHCGQAWTGKWVWKNTTNQMFTAIVNSDRHRLINVPVSASQTSLDLNLLSVHQVDGGSYKCSVRWEDGDSDQGNLMHLNVTAAVPSQRIPLHRFLVCSAAFLCLPIILGLVSGLSSKTKPQPCAGTQSTHMSRQRYDSDSRPNPPQRDRTRQKPFTSALTMSEKKHEVVYTAICVDKPRQNRVPRESAPGAVYASVKFS